MLEKRYGQYVFRTTNNHGVIRKDILDFFEWNTTEETCLYLSAAEKYDLGIKDLELGE